MKQLFNSKVDITSVTRIRDGKGGYSEAEVVIYSDLPCRINWSKGAEKIQFNKDTYYRDAKLYCRVISVTVNHRVKYDGTEYEIVNVSNVDNVDKYMIIEMRLIA